jgi:hypothetical protein
MKIELMNVLICDCLIQVIEKELKVGNEIIESDQNAGWPKEDSKFVLLKNKISINLNFLPLNVKQNINSDKHYGWHNELYCNIHHDLLTAGRTEHLK